MTRPTYETPGDKSAERRVAAVVAARWKCELVPFPRFSEVDYAVQRAGVVVALLEIKCRAVPHDRYPSLILSAHKWLTIREAAHRLAVPGWVAVGYTDGVWVAHVRAMGLERVELGGRDDRGDPADREPCVHLSGLAPL